MKRFKQILAMALATCALFAVGCKRNNENVEMNGDAEALETNMLPSYEGGIHELNYAETSDFLVKDNKTEYAILIPATMSAETKFAAEELQTLFREATQCTMTIVKDDEVDEYSSSKKYISLGNTAYAAAVEVKPTAELERYGYSIKTVDKSIFINANTDIGVTFGVYGFLQLQFNFDCFSDQYYIIDKQKDAKLLNFAVRNVPDLGGIMKPTQFQDGVALRRMGCIEKQDLWIQQSTVSVHSALRELPLDAYFAEHSKWYDATKTQICYTARGDEDERNALIQAVADKVIDGCKKSDALKWVYTFGQMDKKVWCTCGPCTQSKVKYGSNCAVQIKFINEVAKKVEEWMETEEGKPYARDFTIRYLVYHETVEAPVKYDDATGKYVPIDESVIPAKHTMPQLAPLDMDHLCDVESQCNKGWMKRFEMWHGLLEQSETEIAAFTYYQNYTSSLLYFDSYTNMQNMYKVYAGFNVGWFYEEGSASAIGGTKWDALKGYLVTKLAWNVNLDIETLTEKFFQHYFGDAGDEMYDIFLATRAAWGKTRADICDPRSKYANLLEHPECYPEDLAVNSLAKIEKGLSNIAYLKKIDSAKYETFYKNIVCERISYEYMLIHFYGEKYAPDYIDALKLQTKRDVELNEVTGYIEKSGIATLWEEWGI